MCWCQLEYRYNELIEKVCASADYLPGMPGKGGRGGVFWQINLTLSQPEGQIMPFTLLLVPPDFQTFRVHTLIRGAIIIQQGLKSQFFITIYYIAF